MKALQAIGTLHGFGIAPRLEQLNEEVLRLTPGGEVFPSSLIVFSFIGLLGHRHLRKTGQQPAELARVNAALTFILANA